MPEMIQRSFTKGELAPGLHARADLRLYALGLASLRNFFVHPEGGTSTRAGYAWTGEIKDNSATFRFLPFSFNTEQTYVLEFTDLAMRVIMDGGYVTETAQNVVSVTLGATTTVEVTGHGYSNGDQVYLSGLGGTVELNNGWFTVASVSTETFVLSGVDSTGYTAFTSGGTAAKLYTVVSPYAEADIANIKYTQSADVMTLTCAGYDPTELTRTGHTSWTFSTISFAPTISAPTGLSATGGGSGCGSNSKTYEYVVTAVDEDGNESVASSPVSVTNNSLSETCYVTISWSAVTGADYYNVYKAESEVSDVYGWIGKSTTTSHKDYNIAPTVDDAPPVDRQPFTGADDKPTTVNYYQQRILYAATTNKPQTVYGSQSGNYHSMRVSVPTKDDDAITFTIASQKVNEVRHIVALDALLLLTSGGEWKVTEGQDDVLTPSSVGVKPQSYYGASDVQPVVVGDSAVYIQERGSRVRDIAYTFESDTYTGSDLSILAQHLFEGYTITEMAYAQEPYSQLFLLRSDGKVLGCTYHREHEVVAWYLFETSGTVKTLAVIGEGQVDVLYLGVERTIGGVTKRYTERMAPRAWSAAEDAFCVDCGSTYDGTATTTISGLRHLEGETVTALADGNVVRNLTVTDGKVTLPNSASKVHIGLDYTSYLQTLPIDVNAQDTVLRGKQKSVSSVVFTFLNSRGGWVGTDSTNKFEIKSRYEADDYDEIELRSYDREVSMYATWNQDGQVYFEQTDPLPVTVLAIAPEVSIG